MQYLASNNWKNQPTRVVVTDIQLHSVQAHSALNRLYICFNLGSDYWGIRCSVVVFLVFVLYGHCFGIREGDIVSYAFPPYAFIFQ